MQKPSPHRFVVNEAQKTTPSRRQTPPPPSVPTASKRQQEPPISTPRFAKAPRFSVPTQRPAGTTASDIPRATPRFSDRGAGRADAVVDDEDDDASAQRTESWLTDNANTTQTPEHSQHPLQARGTEENQDVQDEVAPKPAPPRFILPEARLDRRPDINSPDRPSFLRHVMPAPSATEPLPEAFSPHRRGQRFVPGGMAAELQSWVLDTGQAAMQSRSVGGFGQDERMHVTIRLDACTGDDPVFAQGAVLDDGQLCRVMLVGRAAVNKGQLRAGDAVGIRAPTWNVELGSEEWVVGVDWRIL